MENSWLGFGSKESVPSTEEATIYLDPILNQFSPLHILTSNFKHSKHSQHPCWHKQPKQNINFICCLWLPKPVTSDILRISDSSEGLRSYLILFSHLYLGLLPETNSPC